MRSIHAFVTLGLALALGCGDNIRPGLVVETTVAKRTVAAGGSAPGVRCSTTAESRRSTSKVSR
jgi:hypothetical protein